MVVMKPWLMPTELNEPLDFEGKQPELYLTLGRRDLDNHLTCVRDAYLRLREKGYHFIHREFDELSDRSYHPPSNDDAIAWATRLRNKNVPPSPQEKKLLQSHPAAVNGYYPALALVGGAAAGGIVERLLASPDPAVRGAAAETCRHAVFGASTTAALAKLAAADPSARVKQAAIGALGMYANWRYRAAQDALIRLATDAGADTFDRVAAADALAFAVRLQVKGIRQDPAMFRALIEVSPDKDEPVRAVATAALAPAYEPAAPGSPRRRAPEQGWDKWLAAVEASASFSVPVQTNLAGAFQSALKAAEASLVDAKNDAQRLDARDAVDALKAIAASV